MNYPFVVKLATLKQTTENAEDMSATQVFEKSLQYNIAQVELWEQYLKFSMQYSKSEDVTKALFDRAISCVGKHMKSVNIWLLWIDFLTYLPQMGLVNLICYMAVKTPML